MSSLEPLSEESDNQALKARVCRISDAGRLFGVAQLLDAVRQGKSKGNTDKCCPGDDKRSEWSGEKHRQMIHVAALSERKLRKSSRS